MAFAVDCVLDVGANEGQFALALRRSGYRGLIVSFEPVAASYRVLSQRAEGDPLWLVRPIALGADDGLATMRVFRATDFSSLLKPSDLGQSLFGGILREGHDEVVQVRRLDTILPEVIGARGVSRILLKMDTQGYDLEVFRGVGSWRSRVVALQSEVSMVPIYSGMPVLSESLSVYREAGYSIAGLFTVTQDLVSGEAIEADLLMIDPSAATTPGGEPA